MSFDKLIELLKEHKDLSVVTLDDCSVQVNSKENKLLISLGPAMNSTWVLDEAWLHSPHKIVSKVLHKLGLSTRIHARKCMIKRIDKPTMESFLEKHHLNGVAGAKHKFGLYFEDELVALVSFATPRIINGQKSAELVRYCVKSNHSIPGGLDKLLKHYTDKYPCDNIFTYIDLKWSTGNGFKNIGFQEEGTKKIAGSEMLKLRLTIDKSSSHQYN